MSIKIALTGNPNSGKTTLFNALTGSNQYVGNWPGVTVEKKFGSLKEHADAEIVDLPGIYSLTPYSPEETVARDYLAGKGDEPRPDVILNIVDGTNLERNLFLTTQLLEQGLPVVLAVNMMDAVEKGGGSIDTSKLAAELGCRAVGISALKGQGVGEAAAMAVSAADAHGHGRCGSCPHNHDHHRRHPRTFKDDADRYAFIDTVIKKCAETGSSDSGRHSMSDRIDRIVTHRLLALPIFAAVMFVMYFISVTTVGALVTEWANEGVFGDGWSLFGIEIPGVPVIAANILESVNCAEWLQGLVVDGIIGGVGAVLGFVPQMFILFMFLAFLEGCGYMARAAFIMDRFFRFVGLSGKSFIPFLIGTGCSVPAIMAARTIESERERRMTVLTTAFIPCSAKLPVIAMIAGAIFGGAWWVAPSAYFAGVAAIVMSGLVLKKSKIFAGIAAPFVMELPQYKLPQFKNVLGSMWERGWSFIKKAGTIVLFATVFVWFASNFGWSGGGFGMVEMGESVLAKIGTMFAWVFAPLGWGTWQASVAAITGLIAKENIVGTLGVLYGVAEAEVGGEGQGVWGAIAADFSALSAYSFLLFNLLCVPCFAAVGAIRREMESGKWFWTAVCYQCLFAYAVSLCVYQLGMMFAGGGFGIGSIAGLLALGGFAYLLIRPSKASV